MTPFPPYTLLVGGTHESHIFEHLILSLGVLRGIVGLARDVVGGEGGVEGEGVEADTVEGGATGERWHELLQEKIRQVQGEATGLVKQVCWD